MQKSRSNESLVVILADMYVVVTEIIFRDLLKSFTYTKRTKGGGRVPKKSRPTQLLIKSYYKTISHRRTKPSKRGSL